MKKYTKKGITQVMTTVLILSVTISLIAVSYVFFSRTASDAVETADNQTNTALDVMGVKINIDSVGSNVVYIRNTGSVDIPNSSISLYINDKYTTFSMGGVIKKGSVGALSITPLSSGSYEVRATAGKATHYVYVTLGSGSTSTSLPTTTVPPTTTSSSTTTIPPTTTTTILLLPLSACGIISNPGSYYLTGNVASSGTCFSIRANNVIIDGRGRRITYAQSAAGYGINNSGYNYTNVANLTIIEGSASYPNSHAIYYRSSNYNNISSNNITTSGVGSIGLTISSSFGNTIRSNSMRTTNGYAVVVGGASPSHYNNSIDTSNTEFGEPIYYYFDLNNAVIQNINNIGELHLGACSNVSIRNMNLDKDGIILAYSQNSSLYNNLVYITGSTVSGILFSSSPNNILYNNIITTSGSSSSGIYLFNSSILNNLTDNTITTSGSNSYGIGISYSSNNNLSTNKIFTDSTYGHGIFLYNSSNSIITRNNISTNGTEGYGIIVQQLSNYNALTRNNITTKGRFGFGLLVISSSNYNNLSNNSICSYGYGGTGIWYNSSSYTLISNNNISTNGSYGPGIYFHSTSNYNKINANFISTNGTNSPGIYPYANSNYNNITNNSVYTNSSESYGIWLFSSSNSLVSDNVMSTRSLRGVGLFIQSSSTSTISRNNIKTLGSEGFGIYINGTCNGNRIYNNMLNTSEISVSGTSGWESLLNYWNTTSQSGTRIYGPGSYIGGNYYTNSSGDGFSDTCTRNSNGFCSNAYDLSTNIACSGSGCGVSTDYLPLAR